MSSRPEQMLAGLSLYQSGRRQTAIQYLDTGRPSMTRQPESDGRKRDYGARCCSGRIQGHPEKGRLDSCSEFP